MLLTGDNADAPHLPAGTLSEIAHKHLVPGAQLAIHEAGLTKVWESGELEIGTGRRATTDSVFPVGSITKCFTATVAMMLVDDGDVDPDEPVTEHVPEVGEPGDALTLRQLLSHTSGLADMPGLDGAGSPSLRRYAASQVCEGKRRAAARRGLLLLHPGIHPGRPDHRVGHRHALDRRCGIPPAPAAGDRRRLHRPAPGRADPAVAIWTF